MKLACNVLVNDIRKSIHNVVLGGVIYLELSKAFDTVSHWCLLLKLLSYGINGIEFTWFQNYLLNQKQHAFYNDHLSKAIPVFRSFLQGSVLGPTLFLLHLDDIHKVCWWYRYLCQRKWLRINQGKTKDTYPWSSQLANQQWPVIKLYNKTCY